MASPSPDVWRRTAPLLRHFIDTVQARLDAEGDEREQDDSATGEAA